MAGIKNINVISGTGNPVQMQDLQHLWSAINSLLRSTKTPIPSLQDSPRRTTTPGRTSAKVSSATKGRLTTWPPMSLK